MRKNNNSPFLSIIIPVYNVEKYLERCLLSILKQSFNNYEIILVNDGSTDSSKDICNKYKEKYKNISVINKKNGGLTSARNAGLKIASGKYISYIDSDDYVSDNYLKEIFNILFNYDNLDMIIFDYYDSLKEEPCPVYMNSKGVCNKEHIEKFVYPLFFRFSVTSGRCIFKKELLQKHHCKDEDINYGEDGAYTYECITFSNKIYFLDKHLYFHMNDNCKSIMSSKQGCDWHYVYKFNNYLVHHLLGIDKEVDKRVAELVNNQIFSLLKNSMIKYPIIKNVGYKPINEKMFSKIRNINKLLKNNPSIKLGRIFGSVPLPKNTNVGQKLFYSMFKRKKYRIAMIVVYLHILINKDYTLHI